MNRLKRHVGCPVSYIALRFISPRSSRDLLSLTWHSLIMCSSTGCVLTQPRTMSSLALAFSCAMIILHHLRPLAAPGVHPAGTSCRLPRVPFTSTRRAILKKPLKAFSISTNLSSLSESPKGLNWIDQSNALG